MRCLGPRDGLGFVDVALQGLLESIDRQVGGFFLGRGAHRVVQDHVGPQWRPYPLGAAGGWPFVQQCVAGQAQAGIAQCVHQQAPCLVLVQAAHEPVLQHARIGGAGVARDALETFVAR
ncbi:hypothetical protein [Paracidovorax citrulli]|uniref:hypothetical protein n=1 Tax=Paracidovorax citrulli TaxID=80869 RepID=UPI0018E07AA3|nr:hypothetical protein [Paracidovorax citrulli]